MNKHVQIYVAGEEIKKGEPVVIGEDGKLYKAKELVDPPLSKEQAEKLTRGL